MIRHEELRTNALATLGSIYSALEMNAEDEALARSVRKHAWENISKWKKGQAPPQGHPWRMARRPIPLSRSAWSRRLRARFCGNSTLRENNSCGVPTVGAERERRRCHKARQ